MKTNIIKVKDLYINFKTENGVVQAIRGVDLELNVGETLAIVGESGSGKSVVTRAIMGILANNGSIEKGSIEYIKDNNEVVNINKLSNTQLSKIRGREIAMIFQDPMTSLNPVMSIGKQIMEAVLLHQRDEKGQPLSKELAKAKTLELIELVGISDPELRFKQYPHQFSGGMRQRIVIAIALGCEPRVLIADEPTTALDVTIQAQILELIKTIQKRLNLAVIFITHDLGVVANMADRVSVMYAGRIVETGVIDEVFYSPAHPYTWGLLSSMPDLDATDGELLSIPGTPPNLLYPPTGDAFAPRNQWALEVDFVEQPPMFKINDNHYAATWLLDERAPKIAIPEIVLKRVHQFVKGGETNE